MENRRYTAQEWETIVGHAIKDGLDYYLVKGNLPKNWDTYHSGNGEGIWFVVDQRDKRELDRNRAEGTFYALLTQVSVYHPDLNLDVFNPGNPTTRPLLLEFRGTFRPVLARSELEVLIGKEV